MSEEITISPDDAKVFTEQPVEKVESKPLSDIALSLIHI